MLSDPSSAAGSGGREPAGRTVIRPSSHGTSTSSSSTSPTSTSERPTVPSMSSMVETPGRRRSASTRHTRAPLCAQLRARLQATVVLPSPAWGELMTTCRNELSTMANFSAERTVR